MDGKKLQKEKPRWKKSAYQQGLSLKETVEKPSGSNRAGGESSEQSRWNLSDLWLACEISSTAQNVIIDLSMILWFHGFSDTSVNPQVTKHLQMECPGWDRAITARIKQETKCVKNKICFENFPYSSKSEDKEKSVFSVQCWSDRIPYENTCLLDQFFLFFFFW